MSYQRDSPAVSGGSNRKCDDGEDEHPDDDGSKEPHQHHHHHRGPYGQAMPSSQTSQGQQWSLNVYKSSNLPKAMAARYRISTHVFFRSEMTFYKFKSTVSSSTEWIPMALMLMFRKIKPVTVIVVMLPGWSFPRRYRWGVRWRTRTYLWPSSPPSRGYSARTRSCYKTQKV